MPSGHPVDCNLRAAVLLFRERGVAPEEIAGALSCGRTTVYRVLGQEGFPVPRRKAKPKLKRVRPPCPKKSRLRYTLDEAAFDIMSEEGLYWIGMLLADGSITVKDRDAVTPIIKLGLSNGDADHVERFRQFLKSNRPLEYTQPYINPRGYCCGRSTIIRVSSKKLAQRLGEFGVLPRKSLTAKILGGIEREPALWRGVIDGDGSLGQPENGAHLSLCGSRLMCNQFMAFVQHFCPDCQATARPSKTIWSHSISGRFAMTIIRVLYKDAGVALPRKARMAERILAECDERGRWRNRVLRRRGRRPGAHLTGPVVCGEGFNRAYDWAEIDSKAPTLFLEFGSWRAVAIALGMNPNSSGLLRRRFRTPIGFVANLPLPMAVQLP